MYVTTRIIKMKNAYRTIKPAFAVIGSSTQIKAAIGDIMAVIVSSKHEVFGIAN